MTTDNPNHSISTDAEPPQENNPAPSDPYVPVPADDDWDEDDILPEVPMKRWVPDVRPDWWTDEMEAEDLANWEADQAEEYVEDELDQFHPLDELHPLYQPHPLDQPEQPIQPEEPEPEPAPYKRDPDASILQKFHQRDYDFGHAFPHVTPWDQHINKFNAARNPLMPPDREDGRYMQEVKKSQPHRFVCGHVADRDYQPIPTYGQLMLPESYDPITDDGLPDPGFPRMEWSPESPALEVLQGAARDLADVGSTFAARLRVSIGHEADADAIDKFFKVARAMKNLHSIISAPKPKTRKNLGGRPHKTGRKRPTAKLTIEIETVPKIENEKNDTKQLAQPQPTGLTSAKTSEITKLPAHTRPT